jgi:hypothetical protein
VTWSLHRTRFRAPPLRQPIGAGLALNQNASVVKLKVLVRARPKKEAFRVVKVSFVFPESSPFLYWILKKDPENEIISGCLR